MLILGSALLRGGLEMPADELPVMGLVRMVFEWLVGLVLLIGGGLTLVAGIWTLCTDAATSPTGSIGTCGSAPAGPPRTTGDSGVLNRAT
jgi:hypothetical protein